MKIKLKPYVIVSDVHCHAWSAFSTTLKSGVNSRLQIILDELMRAAKSVKKAGGSTLVVAGDLFHVRGSVQPSVLNPVMSAFTQISLMGITVYAIAGNHDLEGKDATTLGNAMQALGSIPNFHPITEPTSVTIPEGITLHLFPWYAELNDLRKAMIEHPHTDADHAIIHAPVNGVIKGLPDTGLTPEEIVAMGYKFVFVGHYHNYKTFEAGRVASVGATTHQTWSDPGTAAGFLLVHADHYEHQPTQAPLFVDVPAGAILAEYPIKGNYVRLRLVDADEASIKADRAALDALGALAVTINATKKTEVTRTATIKAGSSMEVSVTDFVKSKGHPKEKLVMDAALEVLAEARS